jgi:hypothetical protein
MKHEGFRIFFTSLWIIFAPVLGCMWLAAVNYSNNLVYAILYLIASLSFVSAFHTWRNLVSLQVEHVRIHPAFAGGEARMTVYLRNPSKRTVYGIFFWRKGDEAGLGWNATPLWMHGRGGARIEAHDSAAVDIVFPTERRGIPLACSPPASAFRSRPSIMSIHNRADSMSGPNRAPATTAACRPSSARATILPACAATCPANRCGMSIGKPSPADGRFRSSISPAAWARNSGSTETP